MMSPVKIVATLVLVLSCVHYSFQLRCYKCSDVVTNSILKGTAYANLPLCSALNLTNVDQAQTCSSDNDRCIKKVTDTGSTVSVIRNCATTCNAEGSEGEKINCYTCNVDGCNSAVSIMTSAVLVAALPLISKLYS